MLQEKSYNLMFAKRALLCFIICMLLFFVTIIRIAAISFEGITNANLPNNGVRLMIGRARGTIYDCNMQPLTNDKEKIIAAVSPTPQAINAISEVLNGDELTETLEKLKTNKPILCELPREIAGAGIINFKLWENSSSVVTHIIGYTNSEGHGVSGLQAAYDDILFCEDEISVYYKTNALGEALNGITPQVNNPNNQITNSVVSTLDVRLQKIAMDSSENLQKGCVIIADAKNGKIRASVSRPNFDSNKIAEYLNDNSSPLLNRAINAYNVGSVFKPCVAAAGIESGRMSYLYTCTGSCEIIDRFFKCHNTNGHGLLNLRSAIANSCNTYFYNYAFKIGGSSIYKMAKKLNFGQSLSLCKDIVTAKGNLPELNSLENIANLANFSIGQGDLLLSPISMLNLYCSIANNGKYHTPSLVEGVYENGNFVEYNISPPTKVMSESTAYLLKHHLQKVLEEGTGKSAKPKTVTAAGKTATAQTGQFVDKTEICQGWFCGFFPFEEPKYVVIIFSEDITKQKLSCGQIFSKIADKVNAEGFLK